MKVCDNADSDNRAAATNSTQPPYLKRRVARAYGRLRMEMAA